jgi:hypothetical protein
MCDMGTVARGFPFRLRTLGGGVGVRAGDGGQLYRTEMRDWWSTAPHRAVRCGRGFLSGPIWESEPGTERERDGRKERLGRKWK